jgi:regulator of cell morphogenesis and NO signaling
MLITKYNKMGDIILHDYKLLAVLNRFDIKLGFKDNTVEEVCNQNNINIYFFLEIANAFHDDNFFTEKKLKSFSLVLIVEYLKKSHEFYLNKRIPEIEGLINEIKYENDDKRFSAIVKKFFTEYVYELKSHIKKEEESIYPYVIKLESVLKIKSIDEVLFNEIKNQSILKYKDEHDNIEEKLFDLKNIIIKYLPPPDNADVCNVILSKLFSLEQDINNHSRIENKVMIPSANEMEKEIIKLRNENKIKII